MEEKDAEGSHANEPSKSTDGDTHMPQANVSGPGSSSLGMLGSVEVSLGIAVTPFNKNPQTKRAKEIISQLVTSPSSTVVLQEMLKDSSVSSCTGAVAGPQTANCSSLPGDGPVTDGTAASLLLKTLEAQSPSPGVGDCLLAGHPGVEPGVATCYPQRGEAGTRDGRIGLGAAACPEGAAGRPVEEAVLRPELQQFLPSAPACGAPLRMGPCSPSPSQVVAEGGQTFPVAYGAHRVAGRDAGPLGG